MTYPHRVRWRGGRNIHAAKSDPHRSAHLNGVNHFLHTACGGMADTSPAGYFPKPGRDHRLDDTEPVTCKKCINWIAKEKAK